jgi:hypothetical protein
MMLPIRGITDISGGLLAWIWLFDFRRLRMICEFGVAASPSTALAGVW